MTKIYSQGICKGNGMARNRGGWSYVILNPDGSVIKNSGMIQNVTNHQICLIAAIESLKNIGNHRDVELYTNSTMIFDCFKNNWIESWEENNWKTRSNKLVANKELWIELSELVKSQNVTLYKSKELVDDNYIGMTRRLSEEVLIG